MRFGIKPLQQKRVYAQYGAFMWGQACHGLYEEHIAFRRTRYQRYDTFQRRLRGFGWVSNSRFASRMRQHVKARGE